MISLILVWPVFLPDLDGLEQIHGPSPQSSPHPINLPSPRVTTLSVLVEQILAL